MQHFIPIAAAAGLSMLAFMLWSDRHKLLDGRGSESGLIPLAKRSGFYLLVAGLVASAALVTIEAIPQEAKPESTPTSTHLKLTCEMKPGGAGDRKNILDCNSTLGVKSVSGSPIGNNEEKKPDGSDPLNLSLTALGLFVALVTAISLAVGKNAIDEARRAEDEVQRLRKEAGLITQTHEMELRLTLHKLNIDAIYSVLRSEFIQPELGINPTPLLEAKLKTWEEMQRWQDQDFHAEILRDRTDTLIATMDNHTYAQHLKRFFDDRDRDACDIFIKMLRIKAESSMRPDLEDAAQAVATLLRRLRKI